MMWQFLWSYLGIGAVIGLLWAMFFLVRRPNDKGLAWIGLPIMLVWPIFVWMIIEIFYNRLKRKLK